MKTLFSLTLSLVFCLNCFAQAKESIELTDADQLEIAVQKICPVSGSDLGSMGEPIKMKAGDQVVFLCCKGCLQKKISVEHWTAIQKRLAEAQGMCPIMGKAVNSSMESTVVNGQKIFVCCPPCVPKIKADPEASIQKVNASYAKFISKERQAESDRLHVQAQEICPVTGKKLGSMGEPVKVKVGKDEHAFLCCKGCIGKKLITEHWQTAQNKLANAQGVCLVMGQPIDATMKSTVVNGRKIFVCCPPCIEKVDKEPAGYVAKLNGQIANGGKAVTK